MSINRVNISGNIGRDPELRSTQSGTNVLTFTMAVNDRRRNQQTDKWEDVPNWIPCVVFGQRAQSLANILAKGMKCAIEGKLRWSQYQDKNGQKRNKIEVIVDEIEFMSQRKGQNQGQGHNAGNSPSQQRVGAPSGFQQQEDIYDEDCPF